MTQQRAKLMEQKACPSQKPNYFGAAYFILASTYCLWQLFSGASSLSAFEIAPIFFMLLTLGVVYVPLMLIQFLSDLKTELFSKPNKSKDLYGPLMWGVFLLFFIYAFAGGSYAGLSPEEQRELTGPMGLGFFSISLVLLVISTFPSGEGHDSWKAKVKEWGERLIYYGAGPGFVAFFALLFGMVLLVLIAGSGDLKTHTVRFFFYYCVFLGLIYLLDLRLRKSKAKRLEQITPTASGQKTFFPWQVFLILPAILALLVHFPITELSKSITRVQTLHFSYAVAYLIFAYIDYKGILQNEYERKKWQEKMRGAKP